MESMCLIRLSAAPADCETFDGPTGASGHDHKLPLACLKAAELLVVASGEPGGCMPLVGSMSAMAVRFWRYSGGMRRLIEVMTCDCSGDAQQR